LCEVFVSWSHEGVTNNDQSGTPFLPHIRTHPLFPTCVANGSIYHSAIHNLHTTITRLAFLAGSNFATLIFLTVSTLFTYTRYRAMKWTMAIIVYEVLWCE